MQARSILTFFAIVCLGLTVQATYISDHLLGKLAPPLIFLGGAAGTALGGAAVGFVVGSKLCHGHGCGGPLIKIGGLDAFTDFFNHPGSRHGHMRGGHHGHH